MNAALLLGLVLGLLFIGVLIGRFRGGNLQTLSRLRMPGIAWVLVGFSMRVVARNWPGLGDNLRFAIAFAGLILVGVGLLVACFRLRTPGIYLAALGLALNATVIVANTGMPVSIEAERIAHGTDIAAEEISDYWEEPVDDETVLPWLADVMALGAFHVVFSVGDLFVVAGMIWFVSDGMIGRTRHATPTTRQSRA